ncbi:uncharacterized protein PGTG_06489 [Puccinia graminis f. sp. tritici CRL 75-36-700-3]|uniref:Uncharacterized protein n=1 Tax=Puccinia graminis f. sp. tritici (strain CRL 75-36-700-3 / race SCCL) TaxID=418459 RepID=E3K8R6_PUCGT|nr:uncharacterized protein PGTG_06489 [Puccinia graminis f. sp. tritici CRL 75-36-700-3]EFP80533.2 hypothetical protein PGTG_06489 [Puccinia graminis f. sp. tritici CRL 75-36-700-3]
MKISRSSAKAPNPMEALSGLRSPELRPRRAAFRRSHSPAPTPTPNARKQKKEFPRKLKVQQRTYNPPPAEIEQTRTIITRKDQSTTVSSYLHRSLPRLSLPEITSPKVFTWIDPHQHTHDS